MITRVLGNAKLFLLETHYNFIYKQKQLLPSYGVNIESCQPEDQVRGKATSRGLTTWCPPHSKAITVLLYRSYSQMCITWMFGFAEDNKIFFGIENTITESRNVHRVVSLVSKLFVKHPNCLITCKDVGYRNCRLANT